MSFTSPVFIFFFLPLTLAGYYLMGRKLKNIFLLAASLAFYAWGAPSFVLLLAISVMVNYGFGLLMDRPARRLMLILALVWNFGLLFCFKYLAFCLDSVGQLFSISLPAPQLALPLGISFFTFRSVSYLLDVYWGTTPVEKNFTDLAVYITFFPQLTMGPIEKYSHFRQQLHGRNFQLSACSEGAQRIIIGLCKKLILANGLAVMVDTGFSMAHSQRPVLLAWLAILGYLLQLYYDFSGYCDVAIGLGKLFGFQTTENFKYPYLSKSITEYWSRWHISLGAWFRDYLYMPLFRTLSRKKRCSVALADGFSLLAVWIFTGLWHGAAWTFVFHGLYNFAFIFLERTRERWQKHKRKRLGLKKQPMTKLQAFGAHIYFLIVLLFGQLLFRIPSIREYLPYIASMFGLAGNPLTDPFSRFLLLDSWLVMLLGVVFCFPVGTWITGKLSRKSQQLAEYIRPVLYGLLYIVALVFLLSTSADPFIYQNF